MLKIIIDIFKDFKIKVFYFIAGIMVILYTLVKYGEVTEKTYKVLISTLHIILLHWVSVIIIVGFIIGVVKILKYSDEKSNERIKKYNKPCVIESHKNNYIDVKLIEKKETMEGKWGETLEILLKNVLDTTINELQGSIHLYIKQKRIKKIDFKIENLRASYVERVFYELISFKERNWDEFDVFIQKIKISEKIEENFFIYGKIMIRTYYMILNFEQFFDYKCIGIRTKYNLVVLKEILRKACSYIMFFSLRKRKVYFNEKHSLYLAFKDLIWRFVKFLIVIAILFLMFLPILYSGVEIFKVTVSLYYIWKDYFQQIVKVI
ncbi:hypothetical protein ACJDU8_02325 [Clostridium sp. WILCCON 0269]|uniref:Uncharacterized protein n=1 Tax=Candidatus Clostridium eludens TaxID=3381663 RepID=A0ABW8SEV9_9CLOT